MQLLSRKLDGHERIRLLFTVPKKIQTLMGVLTTNGLSADHLTTSTQRSVDGPLVYISMACWWTVQCMEENLGVFDGIIDGHYYYDEPHVRRITYANESTTAD